MDILVYKDGRFVCTENPLKAGSLEGLAMLVTNPQDGDVLKYDAASGTWLNGTGSDFAPTITSPQNGQVIKYNGTAWVNGTGGGDFAPDITNPQDGQVLVYDGTAGKWVNGAASGGMVVPVLTTADHGATWTCSHTYAEIAALITAGKCNQIKTVEEGVIGSVYETLVSVESSQIVFCDVYVDGDGARMTDYIITPDGISVEETKYPDDTSPT